MDNALPLLLFAALAVALAVGIPYLGSIVDRIRLLRNPASRRVYSEEPRIQTDGHEIASDPRPAPVELDLLGDPRSILRTAGIVVGLLVFCLLAPFAVATGTVRLGLPTLGVVLTVMGLSVLGYATAWRRLRP